MKKIITLSVIVLGMFFSWHGFSQSSNTEDINRAKVKYRKSLQYNDYGMAKNAIYDLMVLEPS
ncbi:MAG: putative negative regulator of RcsB-dependent stress response, partial [Marivirga sp.]